jgi:ATP-binding cassette, subfamily C, bacterial LapB
MTSAHHSQSVNTSAQGPDAWLQALLSVAYDMHVAPSPEEARLAFLSAAGQPLQHAACIAAQAIGLRAHTMKPRKFILLKPLTPVLAQLHDGAVIVIKRIESAKKAVIAIVTATGLAEHTVACDWLDGAVDGAVVCIASVGKARDARIDAFLAPYQRSWFRAMLSKHLVRYFELAGGAAFANVLALATAIYAMQIWDRVIPAQSAPTLWVLTFGVAIALAFELLLKMMRVAISDNFGKSMDLQISSLFFTRALYLRNDKRPKSSGTLITQLRELDQVRELLTSTTLAALFELPFIAIFMIVIALIGGPLVYVVLAVVPIVLFLCVLVQRPLARLSREGMRESALRNAMLVEAIERIEDIKALQAEQRFAALWQEVNAAAGVTGLRQRFLSALLMNGTQTVQQVAYVAVLVVGVHIVLANGMTTGALLACSILTSRTIAPLAQIASVFTKLQSAKVARDGLDRLLRLPTDQGGDGQRFHRPVLSGSFEFDNVIHTYDEAKRPALSVQHLSIKPGERIALLGRIGSGKSTLLKLAGGLMPPTEGRILLDGSDLAAIECADVRRDIGTLYQDSGLFYGTIRSNLKLAAPDAPDTAFATALDVACANTALFGQAQGLDHVINEGGRGLSSGQRQSLLLARMLVRSPRLLLLDEPTSAFDENTERQFVANLKQWLGSRGLIVATHRHAVLDIVDRIVVLDGGKVVLDGPRDDVLRLLSGRPSAPPLTSISPVPATRSAENVASMPPKGHVNAR